MNTRKRFIAALAAFVIAVSAVFAAIPLGLPELAAATDTSKDKEAELKAQLKSAQQQQADAKAKLENAKKGVANAEKEKEYLDSVISSTQTEIDLTNELIEEYDGKIKTKEAEIVAKQDDIDLKFDQMMTRLRFIREEGTATYLEMILHADSLTDFLTGLDRVGSLMDFDRSLMVELSSQLKVLKDEKVVLESIRTEQEELKTTLSAKVEDLNDQLDAQNAYIARTLASEEEYQKEYEKAKAAEKEANAQIEKLLAERQKSSSGPYWGGEFIWPVDAKYRRISSPYGWRNLWGRSDFHLGIDIPGAYGSNIYASNGGTVVVATYHYSYGNYIVIDHGGGYSTLYGHNSKLLVKVGDKVNQGDVIAKMGSTGNSSGNHCHFEVRINGKTQNPLNYVRQP